MKVTSISVSYDRTITNPNDRYAPFKFGVILEASLAEDEKVADAVPQLQAAARALVEREIQRVVPAGEA